jgi:peptidyl-prolyl cis-trans isomerase B (cyclophilin B)
MANRTVTMETTRGTIAFVLHEDKAPITTSNFVGLAERGFYDGLSFHRVEPGFVIQGGDPLGNGMGGSGTTIKLETHPDLRHDRAGTVAMARSSHPDSASSQFYITLAPTPFLDNNYAVFGHVIDGQSVADAIRRGDTIVKVTVE